MSCTVKLLGKPAITWHGETLELPVGLPAALLYVLAFKSAWVQRDEAAFLFWPDEVEATAKRNLRNLLTRLKPLDYTETLEIERTRLRWRVDTDLQTYRAHVEAGQLDDALACYSGELLAGVQLDDVSEFNHWLELERDNIRKQHETFALEAISALAAEHNYHHAAEVLGSLRQADPFNETLLRQQLEYLRLSGQKRRALAAFETFSGLLAKDMDAVPEDETLELIEAVKLEPDSNQNITTPSAVPGSASEVVAVTQKISLPVQLTPFIGRQAEQTRIAEQLTNPACRLLTLLAPGGFGKTRLALAAAETQQDSYENGAIFVALADTTTIEQMLYAIADALNPALISASNLMDNLKAYLADKDVLLVLDNLEQLSVDHVGADLSILSDLLAAAPGVRILATSRARLNLQSEWLMDVSGLNYPSQDDDSPEVFDAVKLFCQTAQRLDARFSLQGDVVRHVTDICQLVEGMPLALELAASWFQVLSLAEIKAELMQGLDLLESSAKDIPARQRSMRAVFDSSWHLLTAQEQEVLVSLAVFEAGFSREAAQQVSQASLMMLAKLVDKSLLTRASTGRYHRHPLIWQYTQEKLGLHAAQQTLRSSHASYFLERLQTWSQDFYTGKQHDVLQLIEADLANINLAWNWALDHQQYHLLRFNCDVLEKFFIQSNRFTAGLEFFQEAENQLSAEETLLLAEVLVSQASFHDRLGNNSDVVRCAAQAYDLAHQIGDVYWMAQSLNIQAIASIHQGNYRDTQAYLEQALELSTTEATKRIKARASNNLALTHLELGNYEQAKALYVQALALNKELGHHLSHIKNLSNLGNLLYSMKQFEEASTYFQQGLVRSQDLGFQEPLHHIYSGLAMVTIELNDLVTAKAYALNALKLAKESGERTIEVEALRSLAKLAWRRQDTAEATDLLYQAANLARQVRALPYLQDVLVDLAAHYFQTEQDVLATKLLHTVINHSASSQTAKEEAQDLLKSHGVPELQESDINLESLMQIVLADNNLMYHN